MKNLLNNSKATDQQLLETHARRLRVPKGVLPGRAKEFFAQEEVFIRISLVGFYPPSPVPDADFLEEIAKALVSEGHEVTVLAPTSSVAQENKPKIIPIACKWNWIDTVRIARQVIQENADVVALVYVWYLGNGHPAVTLLPYLLRKMGYKGRFVTVFENQSGFTRKRHPFVSAALLGLRGVSSGDWFNSGYGSMLAADRIICLSLDHAKVISDNCKDKSAKIITIPPFSTFVMAPPGDESRLAGRRLLGIRDSDTVVTFFGYLRGAKRVEMLIDAADKLRQRPNVKYVIAGAEGLYSSGYTDSLKLRVRELGLQDRFIFTGSYPAGSVDASLWLRGSDICVLPLKGSVNLNNSSLSAALRHGLPTIVTEDNSASKRLDAAHLHTFTKTVVDADAVSLSHAIAELMDDHQGRDELRKVATAAAEVLYSPSAYAKALTVFDGTDFGIGAAGNLKGLRVPTGSAPKRSSIRQGSNANPAQDKQTSKL